MLSTFSFVDDIKAYCRYFVTVSILKFVFMHPFTSCISYITNGPYVFLGFMEAFLITISGSSVGVFSEFAGGNLAQDIHCSPAPVAGYFF